MDIFAKVPPLWDVGQDLYVAVSPADAMEWREETFPRYNPGIERATSLIGRALSILRSLQ